MTRDTLDGGLSEAEETDRYRHWAEAKQTIRPLLTPGAEQLLDTNTHDGVLDSLRQVGADIVELRALIGDNQEAIDGLLPATTAHP